MRVFKNKPTGRPRGNPLARLLDQIEVSDSGCWLWSGYLHVGPKATGYPQFYYTGKRMGAHIASYRMFKGDVPTGLVVDHVCGVRRCAAPYHLEAKTQQQNIVEGHARRKKAA